MELSENLKLTLLSSLLKDEIICLLFYGSAKNREDFHGASDFDFHLVVKYYTPENIAIMKNLLSQFNNIDISIQSLDEIKIQDKIIFQNGTQGIYFAAILSKAEVLIGDNIYSEMLSSVPREEIEKSIKFKIREYDWRLRRYLLVEKNIGKFKKYATRILTDILCLHEIEKLTEITNLPSRKIINLFIDYMYSSISHKEIQLIKEIDYLDKISSVATNIEDIYLLIHRFVMENV